MHENTPIEFITVSHHVQSRSFMLITNILTQKDPQNSHIGMFNWLSLDLCTSGVYCEMHGVCLLIYFFLYTYSYFDK